MSKFKVGDRVVRTKGPVLLEFVPGYVYEVEKIEEIGTTGQWLQLKGVRGGTGWDPQNFELASSVHIPAIVLTTDMIQDSYNQLTAHKMKTEPISSCDCGGLKTYNTMSPEAHSRWCKSIRGNS